MWKLALALATILLQATPALAQSYEPWANNLFLKKVKHDFGNVPRGAEVKHSFTFKNIYNVPIRITNVDVSCGCLTAKPSKAIGDWYQPNETATFDVAIDAVRFTGPKSVQVKVTVGPEYISTAVLYVTANIRTDVAVTPGQISFGVVPQGQQPTQTVNVDYTGFLDWRVKEVVKPSDAPLNVTMEQVYRTPPKGMQPGRAGYKLTVKLAPDAPGGLLKHDLVLKTNDPNSESLVVSVDANVQAPLRVAPSQINFGTLKLGETKTYKVQVQGNRPFKVIDVKAEGKEITAELPQQPAAVHTLTLRCQPLALGELKRTVTIFTDLESNASVTVTIQAMTVQVQ